MSLNHFKVRVSPWHRGLALNYFNYKQNTC